jgi:hypothetical protein
MRFHATALHCSAERPCVVDAEYIHSWNESYVSNVVCKVFVVNGTSARTQHEETTVIHGNSYQSKAIHDTVPRMNRLATLYAKGDYEIECTNVDNKLACFSGIRCLRL